MTAITLKKKLHEAIDTVSDSAILEAVYTMLHRHKVTTELTPMSAEEFYAGIQSAEKQIQKNMLIDHKEVKKYIQRSK